MDGNASAIYVTQAEHARRCGVSRKSVTQWKHEGKLVMVDGLVDFERSYRGELWHGSVQAARAVQQEVGTLALPRGAWLARLHALDWTHSPDWSDAAQRQRVQDAAAAMGLEAVESEQCDDGHWQQWQLRDPALVGPRGGLVADAIVAGFGFELSHADALRELRAVIERDTGPGSMADVLELHAAAVQLLAYPLSQSHRRPHT